PAMLMPLPTSPATNAAVADVTWVEAFVTLMSVPERSGVSDADDPPLVVFDPPVRTYHRLPAPPRTGSTGRGRARGPLRWAMRWCAVAVLNRCETDSANRRRPL